MFPSKLLTGSLLTFSVVSTAFFGATIPSYAGSGRCGDSASPCQEPQSANQPTVTIKYTITNNTKKTIKFGLPSGRTYQLAPGQKGSYNNTSTKDRLRLSLIDEGKFYPLKDGDYQFRENSNGQIILARTQANPRTPTARRTLTPSITLANPLRTRTQLLPNISVRVPAKRNLLNETPTEPQTEEPVTQDPETQEPVIQDPGTSTTSGSNSIGLEIIREIAGIVKTAIISNSQNNQQNPVEQVNNQPTTTENENPALPNSTNSLPETPPQIAQAGGSVDEVLAKWGWTKVACDVGTPVVAITGLGNGDVCVNPTQEVAAGKYEYNRTSHQLKPVSQ